MIRNFKDNDLEQFVYELKNQDDFIVGINILIYNSKEDVFKEF